MKAILLGATVLMGLSAPAWADINSIRIDATTAGSVKTLSITQDDTNLANQVGGLAGGSSTLPVKGPWKTITIDQQGGTNVFNGSLKATGGSANATLTASYAGGKNTHSIEIGTTTPPANPTVAIAVTNSGSSANTITDTLDGTSLTYNLTLTGTGNSVTNTVAATGAVTLNQGITGDRNIVSNTASAVASFTHTLTLTGNDNSITNNASGAAAKTFTQTIGTSGNTIAMTLDSSDAQTGALTVGSGSMVDYALHASADNSTASVLLSNVLGAGGTTPAVIRVTQTPAATGSTAALTVNGGIYEMGTGVGQGGIAGVNVYQNSPGAYLNATVTANANGYTANFVQ